MKIIDKKSKTKIMVSEIPQGSCFLYNNYLYMKLDSYLFSSKRFITIRSANFFKDKNFVLNLSDTKDDKPKIDLIKSDTFVEPSDTILKIER